LEARTINIILVSARVGCLQTSIREPNLRAAIPLPMHKLESPLIRQPLHIITQS